MTEKPKEKWMDDIQKFNLPNAKILYLIYYLFGLKQIDSEQKKKLKEFVILENPSIFNAYKKFEKNPNLSELGNEFKKIYNGSINKDYSKSIIHKAFESTFKNAPQNDDEDDNSNDDNSEDKKKSKKKKDKENSVEDSESKTFITKAIGKMKRNNDSSDDD